MHHVVIASGIRKPTPHWITIPYFVGRNMGSVGLLVRRNSTDCVIWRLHAHIASKVYFLLSMHMITLPTTHHWWLHIDLHAIVIRVQVFACVIVAPGPAMAVKTSICGKVWIEWTYIGAAVRRLRPNCLSMLHKVGSLHLGRVHCSQLRLLLRILGHHCHWLDQLLPHRCFIILLPWLHVPTHIHPDLKWNTK